MAPSPCYFPDMLQWLRRLRNERRALGWKGMLRKRGWKLVLAFVLVYLIRDLVLYVLIPAAIIAGLWHR